MGNIIFEYLKHCLKYVSSLSKNYKNFLLEDKYINLILLFLLL